MSIHKEMYLHLFNEVSKTIEALQRVQQECESMYLDAEQASCAKLTKAKKAQEN